MVRFIRSVLLFGGVLLLWMSTNFVFNYSKLKKPIKLGATTIIAGDSHLMSGMDPELLAKAVNVCVGAESYLITYYKLRRLINDNPEVKNVILGFNYNNFSGCQDDKLTIDGAKGQFRKYYSVLPMALPDYTSVNEVLFYHTLIEKLTLYPNLGGHTFIGKFHNREPGLEKADLKVTVEKHYFRNGTVAEISTTSSQYLDSIQYLCQSKDIRLALVGTPLHKNYIDQVPPQFITYWENKRMQLETAGLPVFDFIREPFTDDQFKDYDHLAYEGAKTISLRVGEELELTK